MTRRIMIGPLLICPARTHGSPVRTGRTEKKHCTTSIFVRPARASGWPVRTGRFTKNHARVRGHVGRASGPDARLVRTEFF